LFVGAKKKRATPAPPFDVGRKKGKGKGKRVNIFCLPSRRRKKERSYRLNQTKALRKGATTSPSPKEKVPRKFC